MKASLVTDADAAGVGAAAAATGRARQGARRVQYAPISPTPTCCGGDTALPTHARIRNVDLDPAKRMPGVKAVLGAWDVPKNSFGMIVADTPVLADSVVRYVGEPVAIVAAEDPVVARRAVAAIEVDYEILPAVLDPVGALNAGAVYRHVKYKHGDPDVRGRGPGGGEYVTPVKITRSWRPTPVSPDRTAAAGSRSSAPRGGACRSAADRRGLGTAEELVLVRNSGWADRSAAGSRSSGSCTAPCWHSTRADRSSSSIAGKRPCWPAITGTSRIWLRHHATRDGRLVKLEARILLEDGPYQHAAGAGIGNSCSLIQGPYFVPNAVVEGWSVATNNGMCGSMRGFGVVEPMFACESNMDNLARMLGMDGAELRRINAIHRGDRWIFNQLQDRPLPPMR